MRPNIVLLVADSLPSWMLGCYGNKEIRTPNVDRLAQTGVRFSLHFAASSGALANYATLLTGRTPLQHRVDLSAPQSFGSEVLLSDLLAKGGYTCGFAGHWGLGNESQPQHGYTYWQPGAGGQTTAKAAAFIAQQSAGHPFFLTVRWPETSAAAAAKYAGIYAQAKLDSVNYEPMAPNAVANKEMFRATLANLRQKAVAATAFDAEIPAVLEALRQRGVLDQTVVVFTSAGGALAGRHGLWGDGTASDPVNLLEETVALPLIWRWPSRVPPGTARTDLVSAYDLLPSVCEATGVPLPRLDLPGRSYFPLLTNTPLPKRDPWKTQVFASLREAGMGRENRFKLVQRNNGDGPNELYDMASDPTERVNLYANPQYVTVRERLGPAILAWRKHFA